MQLIFSKFKIGRGRTEKERGNREKRWRGNWNQIYVIENVRGIAGIKAFDPNFG